jgi:hypothetical protein
MCLLQQTSGSRKDGDGVVRERDLLANGNGL